MSTDSKTLINAEVGQLVPRDRRLIVLDGESSIDQGIMVGTTLLVNRAQVSVNILLFIFKTLQDNSITAVPIGTTRHFMLPAFTVL